MKQTEWELLPKSTNGWSFCLTLQADHWSISPEIAVSIILAFKTTEPFQNALSYPIM